MFNPWNWIVDYFRGGEFDRYEQEWTRKFEAEKTSKAAEDVIRHKADAHVE